MNARGLMLASICRGSFLLAKSDVVNGKRMTGFNDAKQFPISWYGRMLKPQAPID